jgi:hypothetical protein
MDQIKVEEHYNVADFLESVSKSREIDFDLRENLRLVSKSIEVT